MIIMTCNATCSQGSECTTPPTSAAAQLWARLIWYRYTSHKAHLVSIYFAQGSFGIDTLRTSSTGERSGHGAPQEVCMFSDCEPQPRPDMHAGGMPQRSRHMRCNTGVRETNRCAFIAVLPITVQCIRSS